MTHDRMTILLGILNVLAAALGLLAFAYGGSAAYLLLLGNLAVGVWLLKDFDFGG